MRVMIDTNVLISAFVFPNKNFDKIFEKLTKNQSLVLCLYIVEEAKQVIKNKFAKKFEKFEIFLQKLDFEMVDTPENNLISKKITIRDSKDLPILVSAILADVDVLITGDKDFQTVQIEKPEILTPAQFLEKYC